MIKPVADTAKGEQALEVIGSYLAVMSERQIDRLVDIGEALALLYDPHNGPDGLSPDGKIGYATHTQSADDLAEKILLVGERYATIEQHITDLHPLHLFNWDEIYRGYLRVYDSAGGV